MTSSTFRGLVSLWLVFAAGCGGGDLEGLYQGTIGTKNKVVLDFSSDESIGLRGYWSQELQGEFAQSNLRGKTVDSIVFLGPESKPFKLRICYKEREDYLEILAIHSRTFGPGARYLPTEEDSAFARGNPRLYKIH